MHEPVIVGLVAEGLNGMHGIICSNLSVIVHYTLKNILAMYISTFHVGLHLSVCLKSYLLSLLTQK